jgi:hypothetical protein
MQQQTQAAKVGRRASRKAADGADSFQEMPTIIAARGGRYLSLI